MGGGSNKNSDHSNDCDSSNGSRKEGSTDCSSNVMIK